MNAKYIHSGSTAMLANNDLLMHADFGNTLWRNLAEATAARVALTLTNPRRMVLPQTAHGPPNDWMRPAAIAFSRAARRTGFLDLSLSFLTRTRALSVSTPPKMKQSDSGCALPFSERKPPKP